MSVDQRINEGLETIDAALPPVHTADALERTLRRAGRSRTRRRVAGVLAAAAAVTALAMVRLDGEPDARPPVSEPPDGGGAVRAIDTLIAATCARRASANGSRRSATRRSRSASCAPG